MQNTAQKFKVGVNIGYALQFKLDVVTQDAGIKFRRYSPVTYR